ncbi:MAG: CDP-glycerol glycerophosphotransferase family protein, partial [Lachnospiraceae bacterium]|nr:CDP-glycerol glycerophosphotransferase family protein [Lachnospiraceae bacterium]
DYMSYVYKNQGFLYSNMTNDLTLEICSTDNNNIVFQYSRRSYPVEITEIIAKRVNTDLEYALPFEIINDNDTTVFYRTRLIFEQEEENFRPGVYQFYLTVRDGIYENRISLKTPCNKKLLENIYIIMDYPYTIIGDHYYNCMFYNDTSSNLKCSIQKKFLKTEMLDHDVEEHYLKMHLNIYKEVFFDTNCFFVMTNQNQQLPVVYDFLNETELLYDINVRVDLTRFYEKNKEELIYPMIESGANPGVGMFIQNNYLHPSVSDREAQKFSVVKNIQKMGYRRIWGDYRKGIFLIGVTPDLQFAILQKAVYKDGNVQMAVSFNEKTEKTVQMLSAELIVENVFTGQNIKEKLNISKEVYWAELHIGSLEFGKYNVYVRLANGMRSGLKILQNPESYYDHKAKRKILFQKENGSLNIAVAELLLCENPAQAEFYQNLAESTKKDVKNKNRKIWLIGENYGLSARDTGLAFFEYCEQNHVQEAEVYYVTKKENPDMDYLKPYMNHVIIYDSEEHIKLDALAEFYVVSHGIRDVMPSLYHNRLWEYHKPVVYLQHGVIAMKKIGISNQSYGNSIRKFIVSSEFEKKLLVNNRQFWDDEIAVTGLSRYDKLCIDNNLEQNIVWVMPTWRDWLVSSMEQFVDSRFYKSYSELLCDRSILDLLRRKKHKIVFSLHNDFEKYKPTFEKLACDVVEISDQHEVPMSRRVQECAMIISDYSSIIFDAVYLHKPVLLFQFDQEEYLRSRESYVDLESDLPGQVVHTTGEMIQAMTHLIESDFRAAPSFEEKRRRYFDYEDGCNSERIHQTILTLREEMKDEYEC